MQINVTLMLVHFDLLWQRFVYGSCHTPRQLCPWACGPVPLSFLLIFYPVTVWMPTPSMYFPILFWGVEEKESLVQVVLWLNSILKGEQTCLSDAYKTWANSEVPVLLAPCLASPKTPVCVHAQFPPLWGQKGVKSGIRVTVSQILHTEESHASSTQGTPHSLGLGPQSAMLRQCGCSLHCPW